MKTIYLILFFVYASFAHANDLGTAASEFPDIAPWEYRPDLAARIANKYIMAGNSNAIIALESATNIRMPFPGNKFANEKICHLCRLIFIPNNPTNLLRPPALGAPAMIPFQSMTPLDWPQSPFAIVDDIPLSLVSGYDLGGVAESASDYLLYCRNNGMLRTTLYTIPTADMVARALNKLFLSPEWNAMKWKDAGQGWSYSIDEDWAKERMKKQINNCEQSGPAYPPQGVGSADP